MYAKYRPLMNTNDSRSTFDTEKYIALAFQQPRGIRLQNWVEDHWTEWCDIVEEAAWLRGWKLRPTHKQPCMSPRGKAYSRLGCGNVPLVIFTTAVWGWGVDQWLKMDGTRRGTVDGGSNRANPALIELYMAQDSRHVENGAYCTFWHWDDQIAQQHEINIPCEFGDLDRWLSPIWDAIVQNRVLQ